MLQPQTLAPPLALVAVLVLTHPFPRPPAPDNRDSLRAEPTASALPPAPGSIPTLPLANEETYVAGEVLLQWDSGFPDSERAHALTGIQGEVVEIIRTKAMETFGHPPLVRIRTRMPVPDAVAALQGRPGIAFAEPNWICRPQNVPNEPFFTGNQLWALYSPLGTPRHAFGIGADAAWRRGRTGSSEVFVGVVDTDIMVSHPDIAPNVWVNPDEPVDGKDNDGNGYVDDNLGWDFHNDDRTPFDDPRNVHGTHVSGTIGAVGGNGIGVVGVCWKVSVIPCKFLGSSGGTMANAVKAMDYLTDLKRRHGLKIVASNHSYGSVGFSIPLFYAVQRAAAADILVVAAAGNGGVDNRGDNVERTPFYPGSYPLDNVITVAGIGTSGTLMSFSNYSPNWVHLGAPGQNILSTVPTAKGLPGYARLSGTSMSTALVTGAVALYAASRPNEATTAASLKEGILRNTLINASLVGKTVSGGRLNVVNY